MNNTDSTLTCRFSFKPQAHGRTLRYEKTKLSSKVQEEPASQPRIPRASRIMALALHFQELISSGDIRDYADLARLGHVTRARLTQIMNLTFLAPDIQEDVLFLTESSRGRDKLNELTLRHIAAEPLWEKQRLEWDGIKSKK